MSFSELHCGFLELQGTSWRHLEKTETEFLVKRTGLMKVKVDMATREIGELKHP